LSLIKIEMELFKLRYNLYKYLIKDDFKFKKTYDLINIFKNLIYITIIFFILIFIIGYEYINIFIIFFITILIILIYFIELILIKFEAIKTNKPFQNYYNFYKTLNKIFNINYENINNIDGIINSSDTTSTITKIEMIYGGIGYTPETIYILTFNQGLAIPAIATVKSLKDGRLSGEIIITSGGSGFISDDIEPVITVGGISPTPTAAAKFKVYITNNLTMSNIKEYSLSFMNVYRNILRNVGYIDDILKEDINEHINLIKKENDLLKFIDIYDKKYDFLKNFLIINQDKNEKYFNILYQKTLTNGILEKINNKTYLINLVEFEKYKDNYKDIYSKLMNELELKDLSFLENINLNNNEKIIKYINNFDIIFYYLLFIIIIIFTIIFHIFFIK
jgi:hypothetical protein